VEPDTAIQLLINDIR